MKVTVVVVTLFIVYSYAVYKDWGVRPKEEDEEDVD